MGCGYFLITRNKLLSSGAKDKTSIEAFVLTQG